MRFEYISNFFDKIKFFDFIVQNFRNDESQNRVANIVVDQSFK